MAEPLYPLLSLSRLRMGTDGQGVTTLVGGAGCPLSCRWCLNAKYLRDRKAEPVTAAELYRRVKIDDLYFQATGGGVTFGGGEVLLHADFIREFRKHCCSAWRITVETSLHVPRDSVEAAAEAVDEFIIDIKDTDPEIYRRYTGGDVSLVLEHLRFLLDALGPERLLVRVPLIPDYNTADDQARSVDRLRAMGVTRLDVFSYIRREAE